MNNLCIQCFERLSEHTWTRRYGHREELKLDPWTLYTDKTLFLGNLDYRLTKKDLSAWVRSMLSIDHSGVKDTFEVWLAKGGLQGYHGSYRKVFKHFAFIRFDLVRDAFSLLTIVRAGAYEQKRQVSDFRDPRNQGKGNAEIREWLWQTPEWHAETPRAVERIGNNDIDNENRTWVVRPAVVLNSFNYVSGEWILNIDRRQEVCFTIHVQMLPSRCFSVDVEASDCIDDVKAKIENDHDISLQMQELFFAGEKLLNGRTLFEYDINHGCTLELVFAAGKTDKVWIHYR